MRRRARGVTLIELMVALAIFAVLGLLSYRAVAVSAEARSDLSARFERWRDIGRLFQTAESDLLQTVARPGAPVSDPERAALALVPPLAGGGPALTFLKLDGARGGVRRRGYLLEGGKIFLLRWPGIDTALPPARDVLLDHVQGLRFTVIAQDGRRMSAWPAERSAALPAAVEMELDLPDAGTLRRFFVLR